LGLGSVGRDSRSRVRGHELGKERSLTAVPPYYVTEIYVYGVESHAEEREDRRCNYSSIQVTKHRTDNTAREVT